MILAKDDKRRELQKQIEKEDREKEFEIPPLTCLL